MVVTTGQSQFGRVASIWALPLILALFLPAVSAAAGPKQGSLDRGFGRHGRVTGAVAVSAENEIRFALAPGERIVVSTGRTVSRYREDGTLDRSFGHAGRVRIDAPAVAGFDPAGIAVDSRGGVLLAGTTSQAQLKCATVPNALAATDGFPSGIPGSVLTVIRLTVQGRLDPSFGDNGIVSTDLAFPPPSAAGGTVQCDAPSVRATGLAVGPGDRPVLTGTRITEPIPCKAGGFGGFRSAFAARLTMSGAPDPSFGEAGVRTQDGLFEASEPTIDSRGGLLYAGASGAQCAPFNGYSFFAIGRASREGNPDPAFGPAGWKALGKPLPYEGPPSYFSFTGAIATDSAGRILLLQARIYPPGTRVIRLLPNGESDPHFGNQGGARLRVGARTTIEPIAVDEQGRPLLAGSRTVRRCEGRCDNLPGKAPKSVFALLRMGSRGERDRRFGHRGMVLTGFGAGTVASSDQILIDGEGRILVGGMLKSSQFSTGIGFGLARYRSSSD